MSTQHSPGPWTAETSGDGKCTAFYATDTRICEPVCVVDHDDITEEGEPVVKANMRLIAAAPDLLSALTEIVRNWDGEPEDMAAANAAIEKAT